MNTRVVDHSNCCTVSTLVILRRSVLAIAGCTAVVLLGGIRPAAMAAPSSSSADKDCSDFRTQKQAQRFFQSHNPSQDPHRLDRDGDGIACESLRCPCVAERFDNGEWVITRGDGAGIPERPFEVRVSTGVDRVHEASRLCQSGSQEFPLSPVLVLASSGYLRIKSGADPGQPLPFGQSLVLGPAVFGASTSFPSSTLFFNPQVRRPASTPEGSMAMGQGKLLIKVVARDRNLSTTSTNTNQIMNINWTIVLSEPTQARTRLRVDGRFRFTERVIPDPIRTAEFQSFRLLQISSMFIDNTRHDVQPFRYRDSGGSVEIRYSPAQANSLLPASPTPLAAHASIFDSIHTDDVGQPNGNTPSYRIRFEDQAGLVSGPLTPRAFFNDSQDLNDDNLGLWIHRQPARP